MNEIVVNARESAAATAHPQGFENEQQYREYLKVKASLRHRVPVGIAS